MSDLNLHDTTLQDVALQLLSTAQSLDCDGGPLPMLDAQSYTGIGGVITEFMQCSRRSLSSVAETTEMAATTVAALRLASDHADATIAGAISGEDGSTSTLSVSASDNRSG